MRRSPRLVFKLGDSGGAKLKADIAFGELYRDSGLTQAAIGKITGQSQSIVSRLVAYGEFLVVMPIGIKPTEGKFRSLWEKTKGGGDKAERFRQVEQMLLNPPKIERAPREPAVVISSAPTHIPDMVRIAVSQAAFDAIASTMALGSVGFENAREAQQ
jgi:hypothetical protein